MKKLITVCLAAVALFALFTTYASAEQKSAAANEYLISGEGKEMILWVYENGTPTEVKRGGFGEIMAAVEGDGRIVFDSAKATEAAEVSSSLTVSGELTFDLNAALTVPEGAYLELNGLTLTCETGCRGGLRIKGGEVKAFDSEITSDLLPAVVLDYSNSSSFELVSGTLYSRFGDSALEIKMGSALIGGGRVEAASGVAVKNLSSLSLYGSPSLIGVYADVETDRAIRASANGIPYSGGGVELCFGGSFEEGTMTEVLYSSTPSVNALFKVYDSQLKPFELTYFGSSVHTDMKSFSAVYLPLTLCTVEKDGTVKTACYLKGEIPSEPDKTELEGYIHTGWYSDFEMKESFSFSSPLTQSVTVWAGYTLAPPTFDISSVGFTYDGVSRPIRFDGVYHPLSESGFFTYEWFKDGKSFSISSEPTVRDVSDSGIYTCRISFSKGSEISFAIAENIEVKIEKRRIKLPEPVYREYNGTPQSSGLSPSSYYTFTDISPTEVGIYRIPLTLADKANTVWENTEGEVAYSTFEIRRAANGWLEELTVSDIYEGFEVHPHALSAFGKAEYYYSENETSGYTKTPPMAAGVFFVKAVVEGGENYFGITSEPKQFSILEEQARGIEVNSSPTKTDYIAFETLVTVGLSLTVHYNSGRTETVTAERITVSYQNGNSFRYGDTAAVLTYGGASVALEVNVGKASYPDLGIVLNDVTLTYDGSYHALELELPEIVGLDGIPLKQVLKGGGRDVGVYPLSVEFYTESRNYELPDALTAFLTVTPYEAEVVWGDAVFVYNGTAQAPTASFVDARGVKRSLRVEGAEVNAGVGYIARAFHSDGNYLLKNSTASFTVEKASLDLSGVVWQEREFVYDGEEKRVALTGLPEGVTVIGYTNGAAFNAGKYLATASLSYDAVNYLAPSAPSCYWEILPAEYSTDGFYFESVTAVYDGETHYPAFVGNMPVGKDGITLEYSFSTGATHVSEGRVSVEVRFFSDSSNYRLPPPIILYAEITPKPINVVWTVGDYVYNGSPFLPSAFAKECTVTVAGAASTAGIHIATATADDPDYVIVEPTLEFTIKKAENFFTVAPSLGEGFIGAYPETLGEARSGRIEFSFYADAACSEEVFAPLAPGSYYAVAVGVETENYLSVTSDPIAFKVTEIVPIALSVEYFGGKKKAFEVIAEGDLTATVSYNDGSSAAVSFNDLAVSFVQGEELRRGDECFAVSYKGLTVEVAVEVDYAEFDLTNVRWEGTDTVYDGSIKYPSPVGLPEGLTVLGYEGAGASAGIYKIVPILEYDEDNYRTPSIEPILLTVEKKQLAPPVIEAAEYNAEYLKPSIDDSLFVSDFGEYINAGIYKITVGLKDAENYIFDGGFDSVQVDFVIKPKRLTLSVSELHKYLLSPFGEAEYDFIGEMPYRSDELAVEQRVVGDTVYLVSLDPNYVIEGNAKVIFHNYPSPEVTELLITLLLVAFLLLLLLLIAIRSRRRIKESLAALICRCRNRKETVVMQTSENEKNDDSSIASADPKGRADYEEERDKAEAKEEPQKSEAEKAEINEENEDKEEENSDSEDANGERCDDIQDFEIPEVIKVPEITLSVDAEKADLLITDELAKELVKKDKRTVSTSGSEREIINVDTLSECFSSGDKVDINTLKAKGLISQNAGYIKVLARGRIDKPLTVLANEFSLSAVKMIALTGGEAIRVITLKE